MTSKTPRRADAQRSIDAILDAALDALAGDAEASMAEIARRAGVVRATIYVHFPTREVLIAAVTERAVAEVVGVVSAAEPQRGEPGEALRRVVAEAWRAMDRFHALVDLNVRLPPAELHRRHAPVMELLAPLFERGCRSGAFRRDVPVSWHIATLTALVHAASGELQAGRLPADEVERILVETVLGAVSGASR